MEGNNPGERTVPVQFIRGSRAFKQFKNPPQPHMCIQDSIKNTREKVYINVLGWQKIANPKNGTDPIPLYGGMQVPQGCGPNSNKPPLIVFAVMVHPEILRINGKHAPNPFDREGLVKVLSDFVEAMNPTLQLERRPVLLQDRDLAGELKDVWLAVQAKREREKGASRDVSYKVYDIDGPRDPEIPSHTSEDIFLEMLISDPPDNINPENFQSNSQKSSKQILKNAGQESEFDSSMNNSQLSQNSSSFSRFSCERREQSSLYQCATSYGQSDHMSHTTCTPVYTQLVTPLENHTQAGDIYQAYANMENTKQDNSFRKDLRNDDRNRAGPSGWDKFSKCDLPESSQNGLSKHKSEDKNNTSNSTSHTKGSYNFYPTFERSTKNQESHSVISGKLEHHTQASSAQSTTEVHMAIKTTNSCKTHVEDSGECPEVFLDKMQKLKLCTTKNKSDKQEIYNSGITS